MPSSILLNFYLLIPKAKEELHLRLIQECLPVSYWQMREMDRFRMMDREGLSRLHD
jgi:hypothetical protein